MVTLAMKQALKALKKNLQLDSNIVEKKNEYEKKIREKDLNY